MSIALRLVLRWLANLRWSDFLRIVDAANLAAQYWTKSASMTPAERAEINTLRADHVRQFIATNFSKLSGFILNAVLELAVAWLNKKGGAS
jgi:hypothetical protein